MNDWVLHASIAVGWLALFMGVALVLAYRRAGLGLSTVIALALIVAYWFWGTTPDWWKVLLSVPVALMVLLNMGPLRRRAFTRPPRCRL
jgi:hypothetical protein